MNTPLLITLFGPAGSGKGTVGKHLAEHFDCQHIDMGDLLRAMARDEGMTLEELQKHAKTDRKYDDALDERVRALPGEHERLFICSRTAWFLLPQSIKVLLTCTPEISAQRVAKRQEITPEEALGLNAERDIRDADRYKRYLGIPSYPPTKEQFDVVVDSSDIDPETVLAKLVEGIQKEIERRG